MDSYRFLWIFYGFFMDFPDSAWTRRDARRKALTPKKRTLGPTPSIFSEVDAPKTHEQVFGDPRNICM